MARSNPKKHAISNDNPHAVNVPVSVLDFIHQHCPMSSHCLRLVYGLLFYGRSRGQFVGETLKELACLKGDHVEIRCAHLSTLVGTPGIRDNRWIRKAVEELAPTLLFNHLSMRDTTVLRAKISPQLLQAVPTTDHEKTKAVFARLAPADVMAKSPHRIRANILVRHHGNRNWPKFSLPRIAADTPEESETARRSLMTMPHLRGDFDKAVKTERAWRDQMGIKEWGQSRSAWLRALTELSSESGLSFLVMPVFDPWRDRVVRVDVKLQHQQTRWQPGGLYCADASVRQIYEITPVGRRTLKRAEWMAKSKQTKIA